MDSSYYDAHATHILHRPLVIVSLVNQLSRAVAQVLTSTTGLPLRVIDELVEHHFGAAADVIVAAQGLDGWRQAEQRLFWQALAESPPPVIAADEGVVEQPRDVDRLQETSDLILLQLDEETANRLAAGHSSRQRAILDAKLAAVNDSQGADALAVLLARRQAIAARASRVLDMTAISSYEAATLLREQLAMVDR